MKKIKIINCPGCGECINKDNPVVLDKNNDKYRCVNTGLIIKGELKEVKSLDPKITIFKVIWKKNNKSAGNRI